MCPSAILCVIWPYLPKEMLIGGGHPMIRDVVYIRIINMVWWAIQMSTKNMILSRRNIEYYRNNPKFFDR